MGKFTLDPEQYQQARDSSYVVPPEPEYTQSTPEALARVFNTGAKLYQSGKARALADTTEVDNVDFTRDNLREHLKLKKFNPTVIDNVMTSPVTSWKESLGRADYLSSQSEAEQQVGEMGVSAYALGLPLAIFDVDIPVAAPFLKAIKFAGRGTGAFSTAVNKAGLTLSGATVGAVAVETENLLLGTDDLDPIDGALFGAALGLGFTALTKRLESQAGINYKDGEGRVRSKEELLSEKLAAANKEQEVLDELIEETETLVRNQKDTQKAAEQAEVTDRELGRQSKRRTKTRLGEIRDRAKGIFDETKTFVKNVSDELVGLEAAVAKNIDDTAQVKGRVSELEALSQERKALITQRATKRGQITKLQKQLDALKKAEGKEGIQKRKDIRAKLREVKEAAAPIEAKLNRINKKLEKDDGLAPSIIARLAKEQKELQYRKNLKDKELKELVERREAQKADYEKSRDEFKSYSSRVTLDEAVYSKDTLTLKDRLDRYGADLSPEGIKRLIRAKEGLNDQVTRLVDSDNVDLKSLKDVSVVRQNAINKLKQELDDVHKAQDFRDSKTFKRLPKWMQKAIISPIESLLASENEFIRGFAQKLHAGTMYHGKINARNAWNIRTLLDAKRVRMEQAVIYSYRQAVNEGYTGKFHEFEAEVASNARSVIGGIQRELFTEMDGGLNSMQRLEVAKTRASGVARNHQTTNKHVQDASDIFLNYFEDIHKTGSKLDLESFKNSLGVGYIKRIYDPDKIKALGETEAVNRIVEAQRSFAIATNNEFIEAEAIAKAEAAVASALNPNARVQEALRDLGPARRATPSALKQRTIEAFDDELDDVLMSDVRTVSNIYSIQTHGRLALKEAIGVSSDAEIKALIENLNPTPKEAKNLAVIIETIKGTRELSRDPLNPFTRATKAISGYSSVMHTMGFVVPTLTEMASVAKEFGWARTISNFVGTPREIVSLYKNGTPSDKNTIEMFVVYSDAFINNRAMRYEADGNSMDSVGRVQGFLDGTTQRMAVYGGLLPVTDMLRMTTASLSVDFLARMSVAKGVSKTDMKRVEDMGFDASDFERIRTTLNVDASGKILNTDRKTWGKLDEDIMLGVNTMVERAILHPNGITLPKFMTDFNEGQFFPRVMFKFMRFPVESYERMLGRGIQEFDAKQGLAIAGNVAMWSLILSAKDALKEEDKQMYSGKDGMNQLMTDSLVYNSWVAGPVSFADTALGLTTGETTQGYRYSIGGAATSDYRSALSGDFRIGVPFGSINIGDAFGSAVQSLGLIEETNK